MIGGDGMEVTDRIRVLMKAITVHKGVNAQILGTESPDENDNTIMLYIVDEKHGVKEFRVTHALMNLLERKSYGIAYGTTREADKRKVGVVMAWGWEHPETFERTMKEMKEAGIEAKIVEEG